MPSKETAKSAWPQGWMTICPSRPSTMSSPRPWRAGSLSSKPVSPFAADNIPLILLRLTRAGPYIRGTVTAIRRKRLDDFGLGVRDIMAPVRQGGMMKNLSAFASAIVILALACSPRVEEASREKTPVGVEKAVSVTQEQEVMAWRQKRAASLQSDDGWLTLVGLHWLKEGENTVGAAKSSDVLLPEGKAPDRLGSIFLKNGVAAIEANDGAGLTRDGNAVTSLTLVPDVEGEPTTLEL